MGFFREIFNLIYPVTPPSPLVPYSSREDVRDQLNKERARLGRGPLGLNDELNRIAQAWAVSMAEKNELSHGNFEGRIAHVFPGTPDAENVGEGYQTVAAAVAGWMASVPHRTNILGNFTLLGVGKATAKNGHIYWVVDFDSER